MTLSEKRFLTDQDGTSYTEDRWEYEKGEGGGITRIWSEANLIEKGGVNFSAIHGESLPQSAATQFNIPDGTSFLATGVSLVIRLQVIIASRSARSRRSAATSLSGCL